MDRYSGRTSAYLKFQSLSNRMAVVNNFSKRANLCIVVLGFAEVMITSIVIKIVRHQNPPKAHCCSHNLKSALPVTASQNQHILPHASNFFKAMLRLRSPIQRYTHPGLFSSCRSIACLYFIAMRGLIYTKAHSVFQG